MGKLKDLVGQKFGHLTVFARAENNKHGNAYWKCRCDCNNEVIVCGNSLTRGKSKTCGHCSLVDCHFGFLRVAALHHKDKNGTTYWLCECLLCGNFCVVSTHRLKSGHTQSCGCLSNRHGMYDTWIYHVWENIIQRCTNPNCKAYPDYGGRGITIYKKWRDSFQAFYDFVSELEHFGEKGYSLDRIDNNKGYEPGNVRWATRKEQVRNRRNNIIVEYNGVMMTLPDAAEKSGINYDTLRFRYRKGERGAELFKPVS